MSKYSEKIFYLFQLKYRQEARRCLTSLDVVFWTGQYWKCCRERDVNIIIRELGQTTSKLTGSRAQTIPRDIPSFSRHSNIVLMVTWLKMVLIRGQGFTLTGIVLKIFSIHSCFVACTEWSICVPTNEMISKIFLPNKWSVNVFNWNEVWKTSTKI